MQGGKEVAGTTEKSEEKQNAEERWDRELAEFWGRGMARGCVGWCVAVIVCRGGGEEEGVFCVLGRGGTGGVRVGGGGGWCVCGVDVGGGSCVFFVSGGAGGVAVVWLLWLWWVVGGGSVFGGGGGQIELHCVFVF